MNERENQRRRNRPVGYRENVRHQPSRL